MFFKIKTLLTQKLSRRALVFFVVVFSIGFLTIGVMAKEGINNFIEAYRVRKEETRRGGLPQASDVAVKQDGFLKSIGKTLGLLPESETIKKAAEPAADVNAPDDVELTPEEEKILIQVPENITDAQEAIKQIADLISEASISIIEESDKSAMSGYIAGKVLSDYPEVGKVISAGDIQSFLTPKINEAFQDENFKKFLNEELQQAIKDRVSDIVGPNPTPAEVEKSINDNLGRIMSESLPVILKKPTALNILINKVYDALNNLPIFDASLTARVVSNIAGDITYSFDCTNDGVAEKTNGPTSATTSSISSVCYYFKSAITSVNAVKNGNSAKGLANANVSNDSLIITSVNQAPIIDAGSSQTVKEGAAVTLNGSRSIDPEGSSLSFLWTQTAGPSVSLNTSSASPSFTAPMLGKDEEDNDITSAVLSFGLTVTDPQGASASSAVNITIIKTDPPEQTDTPRQYFAVALSGSSLGKVDYLNRIMQGTLSQFSQEHTNGYFDNSFASDSFGVFVRDNIDEMAVDVSKSTFKKEFITDTADGSVPQEVKKGQGITRNINIAMGVLNKRDYDSIKNGLNNLTLEQFENFGKNNPAALKVLGDFTSAPNSDSNTILGRLKQIDPHQFMNLGFGALAALKNLPGLSALNPSSRFEFDINVIGPLFKTIQGYGSCRKSWHFIARCSCRCLNVSYLWDPMSRTCGCGK